VTITKTRELDEKDTNYNALQFQMDIKKKENEKDISQ
jgi:hypothetical protein